MFIVCRALWVELRLGLCVCHCLPVSFSVIGAVWAVIEVTQSIHKHHSAFRQSARDHTRPTTAKSHRGREWCVITVGNCLSGLWIKCEATLKPGGSTNSMAATRRPECESALFSSSSSCSSSSRHYTKRHEEHWHYIYTHTHTRGEAQLSKELVS